MFVVREAVAIIEVYDVGLSLKRRIAVAGLINPRDVASCTKIKCLYICDGDGRRVYRVDLKLNRRIANWNLNGEPQSLSVTPKSNVIVTMCYESTLKEFTPEGRIVREIQLHPNAKYPLHAVQLASGQLLVSHYGSQHRVCRISDDGSVVQSYGDQPGSGIGQLDHPNHLFVDKQGFILVSDLYNNRILLLNSSLTFVRELISANSNLNRPFRLCLDEVREFLYVSESDGKQVSVFGFMENKQI